MRRLIKQSFVTLFLIVFFFTTSISSVSAQRGYQNPEPTGSLIMLDLFVVRPTSFITMVVGSVGYVVSLPFTLIGGNAGRAGKKLVGNPARATFSSPLGDYDTIKRWPFKYNYQDW